VPQTIFTHEMIRRVLHEPREQVAHSIPIILSDRANRICKARLQVIEPLHLLHEPQPRMGLVQALRRAVYSCIYRSYLATYRTRQSLLQLIELLRLLRKSYAWMDELQSKQRAIETRLNRAELPTNAGTHTLRRSGERF
jgi:hypothetical protein